ncbi:MAG: hypothetical protein ACREOJ_13725, partial [Gemmatimonadaceae bacterium]
MAPDLTDPTIAMQLELPRFLSILQSLLSSRETRREVHRVRRLLVCSVIGTAMLGARAPGITAQDADVSPKGSPIAEPPTGTNLGVTFGITNLTTSSHRFFLQCARTGFVTG